jgi:hypothetical protein
MIPVANPSPSAAEYLNRVVSYNKNDVKIKFSLLLITQALRHEDVWAMEV